MPKQRRRRISDLYWELVDGEPPTPTPEELAELKDAMLDDAMPVRDSLKYAVKILRRDTARLNASLDETPEEREARLAKTRERVAEWRRKHSEPPVTLVTPVTDVTGVTNITSVTDVTSVTPVTPTDQRNNQLTNNIPPKGPPGGRIQFSADFEAFWAEYPRKVGKGKAFDAFGKAAKSGQWPGIEAVIGAVRRARGSDQWRKDGGQFIPHPATWLNQMRWLDNPADCGDEDFRISEELRP